MRPLPACCAAAVLPPPSRCTSASTASPLSDEEPAEVTAALPMGEPWALAQLVARGEAFNTFAFLDPADVAQLSCIASVVSECARGGLWRALFVQRWGFEQGTTHSTEIRVLRSWGDEPWPAPWPLAFGFCGARSPLDHLFWFLPMMRIIRCSERPTDALPPALPQSCTWQALCRVRAQPHGHTRLARCFLCDVMEVAPSGAPAQHFRQRWARPCASCPHLAHRACLERLLDGRCCSTGIADAATAACDRLAGCGRAKCHGCGQAYRVTSRFPESLCELLLATLREWRWLFRRLMVLFVFLFWLRSLAEHYALLGGRTREQFCVVAMLAGMMSVSVSQRFHRGVQKIWHTPSRWVFLKVFCVILVLSILAVLRLLTDLLVDSVLLAPFVQAQQGLFISVFCTAVLSFISWAYILSASGVIFCFWKTSLRVPTVADVGDGHKGRLKPSSSKCGLCQLGLCLDNTAM